MSDVDAGWLHQTRRVNICWYRLYMYINTRVPVSLVYVQSINVDAVNIAGPINGFFIHGLLLFLDFVYHTRKLVIVRVCCV